MAPGRNDPCPCGSGRKFKHCHGAVVTPVLGPPTTDDRALAYDRLDHAASLSRFADDYDEAFDLIWPYVTDEDLPDDPDSPAGTLFLEWFQFDFVLHTGRTLAEHVLDHDLAQLTPGARRFLRACTQAPLRLLQVTTTEPGTLVHVKDLVDRGPAIAVSERSGSWTFVRHDVFIGRVADYDDERQFEGIAIAVNILDRVRMARTIRSGRRRLATDLPPGPILDRQQRESTGASLVAAVVDMVDRGRPRLTTTDGDELMFANAVFSVSDNAAVRKALDSAPDIELADHNMKADGLARYSWFETPGGPGDDFRRVLGTIVLDDSRLRVETMSMARARRAQDRLSTLTPGALHFIAIDTKSVEAALNEPRSAEEPHEIDPEIARPIERAYLEDAYRKWLDEPVPALGNCTPREAATRNKYWRAKLLALVEGIENQADRGARDGAGFDASFLRQELGFRGRR